MYPWGIALEVSPCFVRVLSITDLSVLLLNSVVILCLCFSTDMEGSIATLLEVRVVHTAVPHYSNPLTTSDYSVKGKRPILSHFLVTIKLLSFLILFFLFC